MGDDVCFLDIALYNSPLLKVRTWRMVTMQKVTPVALDNMVQSLSISV